MGRLVVIGLDSADAELIERWSSEGDLPAFAALRAEGAWGRLRTSAELMHVSGWPSLYTGVGPATHGLYHAYQTRAGLRGVERARPERCGAPPFWQDLEAAGRRTVVMDAFMTAPLDGHRGIQIFEYGTWTWFGSPESRPARVLREIERRFGPYPAPEHLEVLDVPDPVSFRDRLVEGVDRKTDIAEWLISRPDWDALFVTYGEAHGAGHYLWHHDDSDFPASTKRTDAAPHPLRDVYMALDRGLARLLERVERDDTVLVISADGMGPNHACPQHLPETLHRLGAFHGQGVGATVPGEEAAPRRRGLVAAARASIPLSVRQTVSRCLPRRVHYRLSMRWANDAIDWERTRAFCIPNSNEGYVRVRRQGRDPGGAESPESARELLDLLERTAGTLVHPDTRHPAAARVVRVDDALEGPRRDDLPDLIVAWDPSARIGRRIAGDGIDIVEGRAGFETAPFYTGNHRPNAFVAARGPSVRAGAVIDGDVMDLAPTALALLDVEPAPRHVGSPWREVTG